MAPLRSSWDGKKTTWREVFFLGAARPPFLASARPPAPTQRSRGVGVGGWLSLGLVWCWFRVEFRLGFRLRFAVGLGVGFR